MTQNSNNQRTPQQDRSDDAKLAMLGLGLLALFISQKELVIKAWFYHHMMAMVFWGFMFVVGMGLWIRWRIRKNNKEKIERAQSLKTMKPTTSRRNDYYYRGSSRND